MAINPKTTISNPIRALRQEILPLLRGRREGELGGWEDSTVTLEESFSIRIHTEYLQRLRLRNIHRRVDWRWTHHG